MKLKSKLPALFVPVEADRIYRASDYLKKKKPLYFSTGSPIGEVKNCGIKKIYFKSKGEKVISAVADFVELKTENPRENRLEGNEDLKGKYYYGFEKLYLLNDPIEIEDLQHLKTGNRLKNSTPGVCLIKDPFISEI